MKRLPNLLSLLSPALVSFGSLTGSRLENIQPSALKSVAKTSILATMLCVFASFATAAAAKDCSQNLPPSLVRLLADRFPKYREPSLTDLDQQSVAFDRQEGGDGCFATATGDFDGNGAKDVAVLLVPIEEGKPLLTVALRRKNAWSIHQLPTFCNDITFCYVKTEKPGTYVRSESLDGPLTGPDERMTISSKAMSVLSGRVESTAVVYAYSKGHWRYVFVSD